MKKCFWEFEKARDYARKLGIKSCRAWNLYVKSGILPYYIPHRPNFVYKQNWISWEDFLGNDFLSFDLARSYVRNLHITTWREWAKYCLQKPDNIPARPQDVYKKQWISFSDWVGKKEKQEFLSFEDAKKLVRKLGLKNKKQWKEYCKNGKPEFLPSNPNSTYKEWKGFPDWMGYDWDIHCNQRYHVNKDFFKTWTQEMAYILGFWFADGYIYNGVKTRSPRYIFGIAQCEKYILEDILKVMGSDYPIHEEKKKDGQKTSYRFIIESKDIVDDIIGLGGQYRKSLVSVFPNIPKEYLPDFIRGLWDGDGSAFKDKKNRATASFTCGSKQFIDSFVEILKRDVGIANPLVIRDKRRKSAYYISLSPNGSRKLRDYIYNNCNLFLKRKKDIFDSFGCVVLSSKDKKRSFLDYDSAHKFIIDLGLNRWWQWVKYCKSGKKPFNIPSNPSKTYNGCKWKGYRHWLTGKGK